MSENARKLFEGTRNQAAQEGNTGFGRLFAEVGAEIKRMNTQASMELASALFAGNAFVPYGPGQYTPTPEHQQEHQQEHEQGRER